VAQPLPDDDVYAGAAGVLRALAEAHLGGHRAFDKVALQLRDRLIAAPLGAESGLYVGTAGHVAARAAWAAASGDATAAASAAEHAWRLAAGPVPTSRDVINGQAGLLLVLVAAGERDSAARVADALATAAEPAPGGVQWRHTATATYLMPGCRMARRVSCWPWPGRPGCSTGATCWRSPVPAGSSCSSSAGATMAPLRCR